MEPDSLVRPISRCRLFLGADPGNVSNNVALHSDIHLFTGRTGHGPIAAPGHGSSPAPADQTSAVVAGLVAKAHGGYNSPVVASWPEGHPGPAPSFATVCCDAGTLIPLHFPGERQRYRCLLVQVHVSQRTWVGLVSKVACCDPTTSAACIHPSSVCTLQHARDFGHRRGSIPRVQVYEYEIGRKTRTGLARGVAYTSNFVLVLKEKVANTSVCINRTCLP